MMVNSCNVETIEIECECSMHTPGAQWVYGSEYYAVNLLICVPQVIANRGEDAIEDWTEWLYCFNEDHLPHKPMTPTIAALRTELNIELIKVQAVAKALETAISLHGDDTDEVLDYYTALANVAWGLHCAIERCINLGYVVTLSTECKAHRIATLGANIFNDDQINFSGVKNAEYVFEAVSLRYVQSATIEE